MSSTPQEIASFSHGIDVSEYEPGSLANVLRNRDYAWIRASIGAQRDPVYKTHVEETASLHKIPFAYHYLTPPGPGDGTQAVRFLNSIAQSKVQPKLLALDLESTALHYPNVALGWISYVRKHDPLKRKILLYCSEDNYLGNLGQNGNWMANWSQEPHHLWTFWQYSDSGGKLDLDIFHGDLAELERYIA